MFLESDPIGLMGGGFSTYSYSLANPISWSDRLGLKPGDLFSTVQAAAVDALNWVYQTYGNVNTEYAGSIYLDANGNYVATNPNSGKGDTAQPSYGPGGYNAVQAYYHTHGKCLKGFDNDNFSGGYPQSDVQQADWHLPSGVPSFLETPGRMILRYNPDPMRNQWNGLWAQHVDSIQSGKPCPCNASQK
jgi:uncharacterized protein RhaS with RHS repeats